MPDNLPRLLYVGDVPVESSFAGAILIHRLLQGYPPDCLLIVHRSSSPPQLAKRLHGVNYFTIRQRFRRLQSSRFAAWYAAACAWWWCRPAALRAAASSIAKFRPEAVISVTYGCAWLGGAQFARQSGLPFHLILHDEWELSRHFSESVRKWAGSIFENVYRQAASRLCVSPFMEELYHKRHGVHGSILYPARGADAVAYAAPPKRLAVNNRPLVFAFAGSLNSPGFVSALRVLADCLGGFGGKLAYFGPMTEEMGRAAGLAAPNIIWRGMLDSNQLISVLREEADVLFVPNSFAAEDRCNMEVNFPSKLADYTATGLPLLIQGPDYSSAIRWASEHPGVAEVVTSSGSDALRLAIQRLTSSEYRLGLARMALLIGERYFSARRANDLLYRHLTMH